MVSKGQFVGLDWNRITRLHSQVMIGTQEVKNSLTASRCHLKAYPRFETVIFNLSHPLGPLSCPRDHDEGHLNGLSCYYNHSSSKTWEEAKKDCIASGSNLVKINSTKETDTGFLTRLLDTINFKEVDELSKSDQKTGSTMK